MPNTDDPEIDAVAGLSPEHLNEELVKDIAKRWDPERLMKLVAARAGKGEQLDESLRSRYEKRLGTDLSHVRVHTGPFAEEFNRTRNAEAVTVGGTGMILMGGAAERTPGTAAGNSLLAHELTHVAQATRGLHNRGKGDLELATEEHEAEAQAMEAEEAGDTAHAELKRVESDRNQSEELQKTIVDKVLALLGESLRSMQERSNPRMRRP